MIKRILFSFTIILALAAGALFWVMRPIAPSHPALARGDLTSLVPLREFYASTQARWSYSLSPDGSKLAWMESKWFKPAIWIKPLEGGEAEIFHTGDRVRWYEWSANGRYILYQADRDGWENDVIVSIDTTKPNAEPRSYDFGKDVKSWIQEVPFDGGSEIIIAHNKRDRGRFDVYKLNLETGETNTIGLNYTRNRNWIFNKEGEIFARSTSFEDRTWAFDVVDKTALNGWRTIIKGGMEDWFVIFGDPDEDNKVFARSNRGRDKMALVKVSLEDGSETLIDEDDRVDYGWTHLDRSSNRLMMGVTWPDYQKRKFFDKQLEADIAKLDLPEHAALHFVSSTRDSRKILLTVQEAEAGFETFLLDRDTGKITSISKPSIAAFREQLVPSEPVFIKARDGLEIPAFLSRPKGVKGPAPMVVLIHGGPVAKAGWGHGSFRQWLTNRGYVTLDVNYRGSSGYGRAFREAAIGEVSRKMHTDIVDARQWAVDQGYADPDKVAVVGGSFGGLKTLTALTENPELFAAGININGISDISTMLQQVPVYWSGWPAWYKKYIGDPEDEEQLKEILDRSPITHADRLDSPLMVIQGSNDVRVIQEQADSMVKKLLSLGKPVEYVLLEGAGHQFRNWTWQQRLLTFRKMERFLAKNLGGRADGFDYAVIGAYIIP